MGVLCVFVYVWVCCMWVGVGGCVRICQELPFLPSLEFPLKHQVWEEVGNDPGQSEDPGTPLQMKISERKSSS